MPGWVYVVANKAVPGLVKVGFTTRPDPKKRLRELDQAGLPYPYDLLYAQWVAEPQRIEKEAHHALSIHRENREWFRCTAKEAEAVIRNLAPAPIVKQIINGKESHAEEPAPVRPEVKPNTSPKTPSRTKRLVSLSQAMAEGDKWMQQRARELVKTGMAPAQAARQATRELNLVAHDEENAPGVVWFICFLFILTVLIYLTEALWSWLFSYLS